MKIIDLLNKIANGEEVPHFKITSGSYCGEYYVGANGYLKDQYGANVEWELDSEWLNEEVELLEDTPKEDKKIEKLNQDDFQCVSNLEVLNEIQRILQPRPMAIIRHDYDQNEAKGLIGALRKGVIQNENIEFKEFSTCVYEMPEK